CEPTIAVVLRFSSAPADHGSLHSFPTRRSSDLGLGTASTLHEPHAGADFDGGNGHRTGWGSGPSIDQIVARAYGPAAPYRVPPDDPNQETPYRSLELGVQTGGVTSLTRMIYAGDKQPLHPETNPRAAFDRIFAGVDPSGSGS